MRIAPLADVKARLSAYLDECGAEGPVVITRNGKAAEPSAEADRGGPPGFVRHAGLAAAPAAWTEDRCAGYTIGWPPATLVNGEDVEYSYAR